mmetsp:Transcript_31454/g.68877  ORF Transcript_31454/g.68877 Transcript_31454/m.68877 type:complete len:200 (+) Transcript_31454:757-1356(+)
MLGVLPFFLVAPPGLPAVARAGMLTGSLSHRDAKDLCLESEVTLVDSGLCFMSLLQARREAEGPTSWTASERRFWFCLIALSADRSSRRLPTTAGPSCLTMMPCCGCGMLTTRSATGCDFRRLNEAQVTRSGPRWPFLGTVCVQSAIRREGSLSRCQLRRPQVGTSQRWPRFSGGIMRLRLVGERRPVFCSSRNNYGTW